LSVLGSPVAPARAAAAQVIAKIAKIELPRNQWPTLIDALLQSALQPVSDLAKQATLNTLGFICEELV
jgi:importin subunit beta-1